MNICCKRYKTLLLNKIRKDITFKPKLIYDDFGNGKEYVWMYKKKDVLEVLSRV